MSGKRCVATEKAPKAIGPYSQAVWAGDYLYLSGQIPLDPGTGAVVAGGIEAEARRVIENLAAVLGSQGLSLGDVVKTTIYLTDLASFPVVNEIYAGFFGEGPPARATVGVASLPRGVGIEIEAVAWKGRG